jgi:tRNA-splicing ligase RtcB
VIEESMQLQFEQLDAYRVRLEKRGAMRVPGLIFASKAMLKTIRTDKSPEQVANVAHLARS